MIDRKRRILLLTGASVGLTAGVSVLRTPAFAQAPKTLTLVSWGGAYQAAQSKAVWQPVARKLGITLNEETYNGLADIRLRVRSGSNQWDIVSIGSGGASRASAEGLLQLIDYKTVDASAFISGYKDPAWLGSDLYSTVVAYNTQKFRGAIPGSWADFWDTKRFPGPRAYRSQALGHLEPALMADGVHPDKVYAELSTQAGLKHAIGKIGQLKPFIKAFWSSGAQQTQLLQAGSVDLASGWSGQLTAIMQAGSKVAFTYNQGILDADVYVVPKGAPSPSLAMQFLNEASKPAYQAAFSQALPYGAVNRNAYADSLIPPKVAATLPSAPANLSQQLKLDAGWWRENQTRAEQLYQDMMNS